MSAIDRYEAALEIYADPRHWAAGRDDLNQRVVSWIGPGGLADAPTIAREALAGRCAIECEPGGETCVCACKLHHREIYPDPTR